MSTTVNGDINVSGILYGDGSGLYNLPLVGNANNANYAITANTANYANQLTSAVQISLSGGATGSVAFDGSANVDIAVSITDGAGSGLDSDLLDGQQGSYYLDYNNFTNTPSIYSQTEADNRFVNITGDTMTGDLRVNANLGIGTAPADIVHIYSITDGERVLIEGNNGGISTARNLLEVKNEGLVTIQLTDSLGNAGAGTIWNLQHRGDADDNSFRITNPDSLGEELILSRDGYLSVSGGMSINGEGRVFSDGYHPNADTLTTPRTISLGGDLSGSASFDGSANITITATVADDSHNHTISNVDGLQTALDSKVDNLGGVASGLSLSKYIILSDYDDSVSLNTGIRSYVRDGTWYINQHISETNPIQIMIGGQQVFHEGYHPNADKWTTARTLTLNGDVSGSVAFDGSGNPTMTVTVANDSHTHDGRYYTESESNSRFVNVTGDTMTGTLSVQTGGNQMLLHPGGTQETAIFRNDGEHTYILLSDAGGITGTWNALRPFRINNASGVLVSDNGQEFGGITTVQQMNVTSSIRDTLNFTASTTQQNRGIAFNGQIALSSGNDEWLRLNNAGEFSNGTLAVGNLRTTGYFLVDAAHGLRNRTGSYGTIQTVDTAGETGWQGYSISGRAVFMHDSSNTTGIYDDVNNKWLFNATHNGSASVWYNGSVRLQTVSGGVNVTGDLRATNNIYCDNVQGRVKVSPWDSTSYGMGMQSGYTFGPLGNDYALTFQMNSTDTRGFWWGDTVHTNAQGAMALTTNGRLTVARSIRVGAGESDTSSHSSFNLHVIGDSHLGTDAYFDTTNNNPALNNVTGATILANGNLNISSANYTCNINVTSDGQLMRFRSAGSVEGSISVSGTTVSYNGGHLARFSQLPDVSQANNNLLKGTVMTNLDEMCEWIGEDGTPEENEQLNKMEISSVVGDKNVAGVFVNWDQDEDGNYDPDMNIAMTGDFIIRIAQGVTVQRGDLLMSAGDGTAMPQDDDLIRSCTIAKVTSTHVTAKYEDGSYCVPCVLMAC